MRHEIAHQVVFEWVGTGLAAEAGDRVLNLMTHSVLPPSCRGYLRLPRCGS